MSYIPDSGGKLYPPTLKSAVQPKSPLALDRESFSNKPMPPSWWLSGSVGAATVRHRILRLRIRPTNRRYKLETSRALTEIYYSYDVICLLKIDTMVIEIYG